MRPSKTIITLGGIGAILSAIAALYTSFGKPKDAADLIDNSHKQVVGTGPSSNIYQIDAKGNVTIAPVVQPPPNQILETPKEVIREESRKNQFSSKIINFPCEDEDIKIGIKIPNTEWNFSRYTPGNRKFEFSNSSGTLSGTLFLYPLWNKNIQTLVNGAIQDFKNTFGENISVVKQVPIVFKARKMIDTYFRSKYEGRWLFMVDRIYSGKEGSVQILIVGEESKFDEVKADAMAFLDSLQFKFDDL